MQYVESAALRAQLTVLTETFPQLGKRLSLAAQELQDSGVPPAAPLIEDLTTYRKVFGGLCSDILKVAQTLAVSPLPTHAELTSLQKLDSLFRAVAEAEEKKAGVEHIRHSALSILKQVLAIAHSDAANFQPLLECQAKAHDLHHAITNTCWPNVHPDSQDLAEGKHPFSALLAFVDSQEGLDDDRWASYQDVIAQSFSKPLVVAALRGKLLRAKESRPAGSPTNGKATPTRELPRSILATAEQEHKPPLVVASSEKAGAHTAGTASPQPPAKTSEGTEPPSFPSPMSTAAAEPGNHGRSSAAAVVQVERSTERQKKGQEQESQPSRSHQNDTAQSLAASLLSGITQDRPRALQNLIWQLLLEDKVSLAFHMARCMEMQFPTYQPQFPPWLLRAVVLGRHIRRAEGNLASLLKDDFTHWNPSRWTTGIREWDTAIGILATAAVLPPALLAPQTGAAAVLHAEHCKEGFPQLSEYCRAIADYSEKQQPLDPNVFRKPLDQATWQDEIDTLRQSVEAWWSRAPRLVLMYEPAMKVWRKWQEPNELLHALLWAVRRNDPTKLLATQQAVERFSDDGQLKREVYRMDREVLGRRLGDDISGRSFEQLRVFVREAIGLAQRWIRLQQLRPNLRKHSIPKHAEQLRQEVSRRHAAVLNELHTLRQQASALAGVSSVACCERTVQGIWALFNSEGEFFSPDEQSPRVLIGADLLRIPFLKLSDQGEIEDSDPESLVDVVLDLLANGLLESASA